MFKTKEPKGITLISLVITIIILLILATVAISLAVDSNGLFGKAGDAANSWNTSVAEEEGSIQDMLDIADEMSLTLKPMVTKWNIAAGDTVGIGLYSQNFMGNALADNTDVTINWGDGTEEHYTSSNLTNGRASHTYTDANSNTTVTITGKCNVVGVSNDTKLISIEEWGYTETTVYYFQACTGLARIATPEKYTFKNVNAFILTFCGCSSLISIPDNMFANCTNATVFYCTFAECSSLTSIGAHAFDGCSSVEYFAYLFGYPSDSIAKLENKYITLQCIDKSIHSSYTIEPVSIIYAYGRNMTNLLTIGDYAFANCTSAKYFDGLFADCANLESIPEHLFENTPNATSFKGTFTGCTSLTGNALPLWTRVTTDTTTYKGVPDGYNCYKGCTGLTNYEAIPDYWKNAPSQG